MAKSLNSRENMPANHAVTNVTSERSVSFLRCSYRAAMWIGYYRLFSDIIRYFPYRWKIYELLGGKNVAMEIMARSMEAQSIETVVTKRFQSSIINTGPSCMRPSLVAS